MKTGQRVRIEHWDVAMQQGRVAANNMLGNLTEKGLDGQAMFTPGPFTCQSRCFIGKNYKYLQYIDVLFPLVD